jgi:hypothetical protein
MGSEEGIWVVKVMFWGQNGAHSRFHGVCSWFNGGYSQF